CGAEAEEVINDLNASYPGISSHIPSSEEIVGDPEARIWTFGSPLSKEEVEAGRKKKEEGQLSVTIPEYRCRKNVIPALIYSDPSSPDSDTLPSDLKEETPDEQETEETRRHGELMHSIMENIHTSDDIDRALLKAKTAGHIGLQQKQQLKDFLTKAVQSVERYGWFAPGSRVINERGIVISGKVRRPDRIVIRPDGSAAIIDYKFGDHRNDKAYSRQVKRYAEALLRTGLAKKCEAYIWYVSLGEVVSCKL
ncbi:MAG: PD-(D/E)XK nuclease family protein, partial [Muribaculaceae bacterium]|nr:PD-(D/E)XK nuclease family protein [Muribaculaceae bacterium]